MNHSKLVTLYAVSAFAISTASAAFAGGYTAPVVEPDFAPVVAPVATDWAGAYVGGSLGYTLGGDDVVGLEQFSASGASINRVDDLGNVDLKGVNAGAHVGYRWQKDNWVFGPELSIEGGSVDANQDVSAFGVNSNVESSVNYMVSLRMKTGYLVNPETLVYGTFGVAHGDFDYTAATANSSVTKSFTDTGIAAGLGAERKLNDKLSMFAEWEFRAFGKTDLGFDNLGADETVSRATPEVHNLKVGVNYRF